jgi:hypothetical protein
VVVCLPSVELPERMTPLRVISPPEPCCQTRCRYSADSVRLVLKLLRSGEDIDSLLSPHGGYDQDRLAGFGPSFGPTWTLYVADLRRAQQAGCRTPEQVARFLCPFSDMGEDDLLEAA